MNPDRIEREFKLRARNPIEPAQVDALALELGGVVANSARLPHRDIYHDDAQGSLARAGVGLRHRQSDHGDNLCFKTAAEVHDGLLLRSEVEEPWDQPMPTTAAGLPPLLRAEVEPFTLDRELRPVLNLQVEREQRHLIFAGGECDVAIDHVTVVADERTAHFAEIEVEVDDDNPPSRELVQRLCTQLTLAVVVDSKLEHAHGLLGLPAIEATTLELQPMLGLGTALRLLLRDHLQAQRRQEAGTRLDRDPEHLHQMRVANRRMRALVRAFPELWPDADYEWLRQHLARSGRALGALRDLDVTLAELEPLAARAPAPLRTGLEPLRQMLLEQRTLQAATTRAFLEDPARLTDERRLEQLLLDAPSPPSSADATPVAQAVLRVLNKAARQVRRLGSELPDELPLANVHELRVALKRLRYLLEDFQAVLPDRLRKAAPRLAKLQQRLGTICDHENGAVHYLDLLPQLPHAHPQLAALVGAVATSHGHAGQAARDGGLRGWRKLDRRRFWERFEATDGSFTPE